MSSGENFALFSAISTPVMNTEEHIVRAKDKKFKR
jgi:hypothetical protein